MNARKLLQAGLILIGSMLFLGSGTASATSGLLSYGISSVSATPTTFAVGSSATITVDFVLNWASDVTQVDVTPTNTPSTFASDFTYIPFTSPGLSAAIPVSGATTLVYTGIYTPTLPSPFVNLLVTDLGITFDYSYQVSELSCPYGDACASSVDSTFTMTSNPEFTVTSVPEPESYAMMLAGLGLLGFMARRRKHKEAA